MKVDIIYGRNAVLEALRAGQAMTRIRLASGVQSKGSLAEIVELARSHDIPVEKVDRRELDHIAPHHQGVVAEVAEYRYASLDDVLAAAKERGEAPFVLVLDCLQDVQNFGSLLRTAEAVGVHGVIIPQRRSAGVTAAVRRTSAGAVEHLRIARVTNLSQAAEKLKALGVWVIGVENDPRAQDVRAVDLNRSLALVIGGEGRGISRLLRERCDFLVRLPMRGRVSSLNAAVAGAIVLYEAARQRFDIFGKGSYT
jgi:23S rRNA (guanosine2251-2'-O)-methyltransferase